MIIQKEYPEDAAALHELATHLENELTIVLAKEKEMEQNREAYINKIRKDHFN